MSISNLLNLPHELQVHIRSYVPRTQRSVNRLDNNIRTEVLRLYDYPQIEALPKASFLGRIFSQVSSYGDTRKEAIAFTVLSKAMRELRGKAKRYGVEIKKEEILSLPLNRFNAVAEMVDKCSQDILYDRFKTLFFEEPPIFQITNFIDFPERIFNAEEEAPIQDVLPYIERWFSTLPRYEIIENPIGFIREEGDGFDIRYTIRNTEEARAFKIGTILAAAVEHNCDEAARLVLRLAPQIHKVPFGDALRCGAKKEKWDLVKDLIQSRFEPHNVQLRNVYVYIVRRNLRELKSLIEKRYPDLSCRMERVESRARQVREAMTRSLA